MRTRGWRYCCMTRSTRRASSLTRSTAQSRRSRGCREGRIVKWFGSEEDEGGYLSRYTMHESIRDGATLQLHFEPRLSEIHIDEEAVDAAFEELAEANETTCFFSSSPSITLPSLLARFPPHVLASGSR